MVSFWKRLNQLFIVVDTFLRKADLVQNDFQQVHPPDRPKRSKIVEEVRKDRITQLEEELKGYDDRISYKEKRVYAATNIKNFKLCDELTEEIMAIKSKRFSVFNELKELQKKEKRSKSYKSSQSSSCAGSSGDDLCQNVGKPSSSSSLSSSLTPSPPYSVHPYAISSCSTSSTSSDLSPPNYTYEEIVTFKRRFEEGYDCPDPRYLAWVKETHATNSQSTQLPCDAEKSEQLSCSDCITQNSLVSQQQFEPSSLNSKTLDSAEQPGF